MSGDNYSAGVENREKVDEIPHLHWALRTHLWIIIGYIYCNCGNIWYYNLTLKKNVIKEIKI